MKDTVFSREYMIEHNIDLVRHMNAAIPMNAAT